jgi:hypothetical protein
MYIVVTQNEQNHELEFRSDEGALISLRQFDVTLYEVTIRESRVLVRLLPIVPNKFDTSRVVMSVPLSKVIFDNPVAV